ncbi:MULTISPECIES: putative lipopolysaccharide heptosyltransferase III [unclassified Neisseria]|uniref:putative lipopolysaccharide heptosyltransferase III n=1 Tax=unclassified Neisseria TaxID=2623750 RepID=UPI0010729230|nr:MULTISPECIES: putative lipopolysaccharide heptosyltransferase III [unclassified Neisseria]MBF0804604.1 putative lipopolysaccharide heptosyltransferase III [Neisseria sp. 19428wB4_WF04]TFU40394.1 putative lipopolysaccharide heptosyltransferase III [Neisseria sp. WF04]
MMPTKPERILIIKLRHHGDVLLTTPVADRIKQAYPDCAIDMLVYRETADILRDNRQINRILTIDRQWKKLGLRQRLACERALWGSLKAQRYDWVFNLSDQWRAAAVAKLCGKRSGSLRYSKRDNVLWRFCHSVLSEDLKHEHHIVEHHLAVLRPLQLAGGYCPRVRMEIAPDTRRSLQGKLQNRGWQGEPYVLAHPGSRWAFKCWENDKTAQLLQRLLESGRHLVLTAAPDSGEQAMLADIAGRLKAPKGMHIWILSGCLNLRELAAAIDGAGLFIGVDSVPMHMAAALDKPQVALFGPSWVSRWRPYSARAEVVWAGDFGSLPHPDSINSNDTARLLCAIPVDAVWQAVQKQLAG